MSSVHSPEDNRVARKEAVTLLRGGWDVRYIVPEKEGVAAVEGVRTILVKRSKRRSSRMLLTTFRVFRAALKEKTAICHFHDPELLPYAILLKLLGKKVIYDVHEHLPSQILSKNWIAPRFRRALYYLFSGVERFGSLFMDGIITATPAISEHFPKRKVTLVQNFPVFGELYSEVSVPYVQRPMNFAYVGGILRIRGASEMVDAIALVNRTHRARLEVGGFYSPEGLKSELAKRPGWQHVTDLGWLSRGAIAQLLSRSRSGLVLFHPEPNHIRAQPNKLFEYMSAGVPVIASNFILWKEIIDKVGCGLTVDPLKPEAIAEAMIYLLDNPERAAEMGQRGKKAVESQYNWKVEAQSLLQAYDRLIPGVVSPCDPLREL